MNGEMHTSPEIHTTSDRPRVRHMNGEATPEELQHDLDRTRADLNDTLHAIEQRLSPGQILDQTFDYLTGGPKEYAHNLSVQMKENPLPVALVGIGLAWLMIGPHKPGEGVEYTSEGIPESKTSAAYHRAGETMHGMSERFSEKKADLKARMGRRMDQAKQRFSHASESMRHRREIAGERGSEYAAHMRERGMHAKESVSSIMHEQPMVIGALAVAIGALIGASLPISRREKETMGPMSSETVHRGEEMLHSAKEKGHEMKEHVSESYKEGTYKEGAAREPASGEPVRPTTH